MATEPLKMKVEVETKDAVKALDEVNQKVSETAKNAKGSSGGVSSFSQALDKIKTGGLNVNNVMGLMNSSLVKSASIYLAVAKAVGEVVKKMNALADEAAKVGDQIAKSAQKMELSTDAYQKWTYIAERSGTSISSITELMRKFNAAMNEEVDPNSDTYQALTQLGLAQENLANMSKDQALETVIKSLQGVEDGAERARIASTLFGRSYSELNTILNMTDVEMQSVVNDYNRYGDISDIAIRTSEEYQDATTNLQTATQRLKSEFIVGWQEMAIGVKNAIADMSAAIADYMEEQNELAEYWKFVNDFMAEEYGLDASGIGDDGDAVLFSADQMAAANAAWAEYKAQIDAAKQATYGVTDAEASVATEAGTIVDRWATILDLVSACATTQNAMTTGLVATETAANKASGAAAKLAKSIMGFDELNKLSGSAGGGGAGIALTIKKYKGSDGAEFNDYQEWLKHEMYLINHAENMLVRLSAKCNVEIANATDPQIQEFYTNLQKKLVSGDITPAEANVILKAEGDIKATYTYKGVKYDSYGDMMAAAQRDFDAGDQSAYLNTKVRYYANGKYYSTYGEAMKASMGNTVATAKMTVTSPSTDALLRGGIATSKINITYAARGGIVDGATLFGGNIVAGEAGREAILPLDSNTEWMDTLANKITGASSRKIVLEVDGRQLGQATIENINSITRQAGRVQLAMR